MPVGHTSERRPHPAEFLLQIKAPQNAAVSPAHRRASCPPKCALARCHRIAAHCHPLHPRHSITAAATARHRCGFWYRMAACDHLHPQHQLVKIHGPGDVRVDAYERPAAGPRDVVVRLRVAGICGSDLMYVRIGGIPPGRVTALGHEAAGEIIEVGAEVDGVQIGMRVVVNPMATPSNVGSGGPEGAFTQELLVREAQLGVNVLAIPDDVPFEVAALSEPLAVALHGVNRANAAPGDKVVVFGCGPIGLGMLLWLADRGVTDVVALDIAEERLARARAIGVQAALDPSKVDLRAELTRLHGEVASYGRTGVGTDAFIDCAGAPNILSDVVHMAKLHARMVITAAHMRPVELPVGRMLTSEMTITTAMGYPTEMPEVVAALSRLQKKIGSLISHRFAFQDVLESLKVAGTPSSAKVVLEFE
ncbi:hypothetical protein HK405_003218 [Cladochytrium tenue]|nr:hypothetical protein HK405_003218 [Cladochytrium tenue]